MNGLLVPVVEFGASFVIAGGGQRRLAGSVGVGGGVEPVGGGPAGGIITGGTIGFADSAGAAGTFGAGGSLEVAAAFASQFQSVDADAFDRFGLGFGTPVLELVGGSAQTPCGFATPRISYNLRLIISLGGGPGTSG